jgi:hypothetical protein
MKPTVLLGDQCYMAWVDRVETTARGAGALIALSVGLAAAAQDMIRTGRFADAEAKYVEPAELALAMDQSGLWQLLDVELHAWRGDEDQTRSAAATLIELGSANGVALVVFQAYRALAILDVSSGRYAEALEAAEYSTSRRAFG